MLVILSLDSMSIFMMKIKLSSLSPHHDACDVYAVLKYIL